MRLLGFGKCCLLLKLPLKSCLLNLLSQIFAFPNQVLDVILAPVLNEGIADDGEHVDQQVGHNNSDQTIAHCFVCVQIHDSIFCSVPPASKRHQNQDSPHDEHLVELLEEVMSPFLERLHDAIVNDYRVVEVHCKRKLECRPVLQVH